MIYYVTKADGHLYTVAADNEDEAADLVNVLDICHTDDEPGVELAPDDVQMRYNPAAQTLPGFDI